MSLEAPRATREVNRWWTASSVARPLTAPRGEEVSKPLQGLQQSAESIGQAVNQNSPHNGRGVEEDQLGATPPMPAPHIPPKIT